MLFQPDKSYFILAIIKEAELHKAINIWTLMKNIEVNNKHKNKDMKLKTIYPFSISSARDSHMEY